MAHQQWVGHSCRGKGSCLLLEHKTNASVASHHMAACTRHSLLWWVLKPWKVDQLIISWMDGLIDLWLIDWLTGQLVGWLVGWLIDWLIDWLTDWLTDWLFLHMLCQTSVSETDERLDAVNTPWYVLSCFDLQRGRQGHGDKGVPGTQGGDPYAVPPPHACQPWQLPAPWQVLAWALDLRHCHKRGL